MTKFITNIFKIGMTSLHIAGHKNASVVFAKSLVLILTFLHAYKT